LFLSCQPGELPCDRSQDWQQLCAQAAGGVGGDTPTGGAGGAGGASTPTGTPPAPGSPTADTPVKECAKYPTLGAMDQFFAARCGAGGTGSCHITGTAAIWNDMFSKDVWRRLQTEPAKSSCKGAAKMINAEKWSESLILAKIQPMPVCPPGPMAGASAGIPMPPQAGFQPLMEALKPDEVKCIENFLKAIAGK
jgi:hypothetical protein